MTKHFNSDYDYDEPVPDFIFIIYKGWIDPLENRDADGYDVFAFTENEQEAKDFCNSKGYWTDKDCWSILFHANERMPKYKYEKIESLR